MPHKKKKRAQKSRPEGVQKDLPPVALLHGITDHCPRPDWSDKIERALDYRAVVKCVEAGDGEIWSIFEDMWKQANSVCHKLKNDPDFAGKPVSLVGLSAGGLIARAVVETCDGLEVHTLYSYGAPHAGFNFDGHWMNHWYSPMVWKTLGFLAGFELV